MVSGINNGYYNPYQYNMYDQTAYTPVSYQQPILTGGVSTTNDTIFNAKPKDDTADGKDDGSIGFGGAVKNMAKGVWNFLTSPFKNEKGEWSLKSTLKSVAIGALIIGGNILTGGALTPILLAGGALAGGIGAVKAGYNIATAKTDAEAEAAWQSMGSSAATIAATVVGAKGYAKAQASSAAEAEALASGATAEEAAQAGAQAAARYNGLSGAKNAVGRTFVDSYKTGKAAKTYLFGAKAKPATATTAATPAVEGKVQQKWSQVKDNYNNSTKETWYGKTGEVISKEYNSAVAKGKKFVADNSGVYRTATERGIKFTDLTDRQKAAVVKQLRNSIAQAAKTQLGYQKGQGVWDNTKAIALNPQNIGIHTYLTRQTFVPDFYDSLSTQEKAYFDSLPAEQREQLEDMYYAMA